MAVSTATLLAKIAALEQRVTKLAARVKADEAVLAPLLSATNLAFLAGLSKLPHQTADNLNDPSTGPNWATGERDYINHLVNAVNTLQAHLQSNGFEA